MANDYKGMSFSIAFTNKAIRDKATKFLVVLKEKADQKDPSGWYGVEIEEMGDKEIAIYDSGEGYFEEGFLDDLCKLVKKFKLPPILVEIAYWCDKPRTGAFGGSACQVRADGYLWVQPAGVAASFEHCKTGDEIANWITKHAIQGLTWCPVKGKK